MPNNNGSVVIVRELRASDLGWFAQPRSQGRAAGRQRAIQFNGPVVRELLTEPEISAGGTDAVTSRAGKPDVQERPLRRNQKNWRLMGPKVEDADLAGLREGDWLVMVAWRLGQPARLHITWDVLMQARDAPLHRKLSELVASELHDHMALCPARDPVSSRIAAEFPWVAEALQLGGTTTVAAVPPAHPPQSGAPERLHAPVSRAKRTVVAVRAGRERRPLKEHLKQPHILVEMMRHGMTLSGQAQQDFLERIELLATEFRDLLARAGLIRKLNLSQHDAWHAVRGKRFSFVDGGVANIQALGSEPLAIRVGSYSVTPGVSDKERREVFRQERVLVDELFELTQGEGVFEDFFEDTAKLRDAARWCLELAALLDLVGSDTPPDFAYLHGPIVSPVSPYALAGFPSFTTSALRHFLSGDKAERRGRDANFVPVYLEQIRRARSSGTPVVGVVERASITRLAGLYVLKHLADEHFVADQDREKIEAQLRLYRITDPVLFECVLEEGEYLVPLPMDKNRTPGGHDKIPDQWRAEIEAYPVPLVTYAKPTTNSLPIRLEMFVPEDSTDAADAVVDITVHMSRLLPQYAFPAGLDIVDKFAKVPAWMSTQLSRAMAAQVLRKALETRNPQVIAMARRFLTGNPREWLFRPKA